MKKRNLLLSAIAMLLVAVVGLTSASFAWFKFSTVTEVEGIRMDVKASKSLAISLAYNQIFKEKITFPELVANSGSLHLPTLGTLDAATPVTTTTDDTITVTNKAITFMGLTTDADGLQADVSNFISAKVFLKATNADNASVPVSLDTTNLFTFDSTLVKNYSMRIVSGGVRYICGDAQSTGGTADDSYVYTLKPVVNGVKNTSKFYYTDAVDKKEVDAGDLKVALKATDVATTTSATLAVALTKLDPIANSTLQKEIAKSLRIALVCTPVLLKDGTTYKTQPTTLVVYEPDNTASAIKGDTILDRDDPLYVHYDRYVRVDQTTTTAASNKLPLFTITDEQIKADVCWEVTAYVWIEGFDINCSNYVTGSAFNTWLKFTA